MLFSHLATLHNDNGHAWLVAAVGGDVLNLAHDQHAILDHFAEDDVF